MPKGTPCKCPYCRSTNTTRKGVRRTKMLGTRKIRYCKSCRRKFTPRNQSSPGVGPEQDGTGHRDAGD